MASPSDIDVLYSTPAKPESALAELKALSQDVESILKRFYRVHAQLAARYEDDLDLDSEVAEQVQDLSDQLLNHLAQIAEAGDKCEDRLAEAAHVLELRMRHD